VLTHPNTNVEMSILGADAPTVKCHTDYTKKRTELIPCGLRLCNEMHRSKDLYCIYHGIN